MKIRNIFILITVITMAASVLIMGSCRSMQENGQATAQEENGETEEVAHEEDMSREQDMEDQEGEDKEETGEVTENAEETSQEPPEEETGIPEEITTMIQEADSLFMDGLYAEASKEYRDVQIAIEGSELPDDIKQQLKDSIDENYNTAQSIIETARMHHNNAMNLIYEKRYEEAEAELNATLEIYPKYQPAIDALESLEDIKGLQ